MEYSSIKSLFPRERALFFLSMNYRSMSREDKFETLFECRKKFFPEISEEEFINILDLFYKCVGEWTNIFEIALKKYKEDKNHE